MKESCPNGIIKNLLKDYFGSKKKLLLLWNVVFSSFWSCCDDDDDKRSSVLAREEDKSIFHLHSFTSCSFCCRPREDDELDLKGHRNYYIKCFMVLQRWNIVQSSLYHHHLLSDGKMRRKMSYDLRKFLWQGGKRERETPGKSRGTLTLAGWSLPSCHDLSQSPLSLSLWSSDLIIPFHLSLLLLLLLLLLVMSVFFLFSSRIPFFSFAFFSNFSCLSLQPLGSHRMRVSSSSLHSTIWDLGFLKHGKLKTSSWSLGIIFRSWFKLRLRHWVLSQGSSDVTPRRLSSKHFDDEDLVTGYRHIKSLTFNSDELLLMIMIVTWLITWSSADDAMMLRWKSWSHGRE